MGRFMKCFYVQSRHMLKSSLIFMLIYMLVYLALLFISLNFMKTGEYANFNSSFGVVAAFFAFIYVIANYKEMYNYLLMFGNTRNTIFLSQIALNAAMAALLTVMSLVFDGLDKIVARFLIPGIELPPSFVRITYPYCSIVSESVFLLAFFTLLPSFSMVYGSLAYKLGKVFAAIFWICFGAAWVTLPILADINAMNNAVKYAVLSYLGIFSRHGIFLASANFIITAAILNALAYLISRRQPQVA